MLQVFGKFFILAFGALLPLACFGQSWSAGPVYRIGNSEVRRIVVGRPSGEKAPDVFIVDQSDLWLLRGDGKGGFVIPAVVWRKNVRDVTLGKFQVKKQSALDVIALFTDNSVQAASLYLLDSSSLQSGASTPVAVGVPFALDCSIASADFDGDGLDDLAISCPESPTPLLVGMNQGSAEFKFESVPLPAGRTVKKTIAGDFDGDGKGDLEVLSLDHSGALHRDLLWGAGDGTFQLQELNAVDFDTDLASGDFDGDMGADVVGVSSNGITPFMGLRGERRFDALQSLDGDPGCTIQALEIGSSHTNSFNVRGEDLFAAEACGDFQQVRVFTNQVLTQMALKIAVIRHGGDYSATVTAVVSALVGSVMPQGRVLFGVDGQYRDSVTVDGGKASLTLALTAGVSARITAVYQSANGMAWSSGRVIVHGPGPLGVGLLFKQHRAEQPFARFAFQLVGEELLAQRPHLLRTATSYSPPSFSATTAAPTSINAGNTVTVTGTISNSFEYSACAYGDLCPNDAIPLNGGGANIYAALDGVQNGATLTITDSSSGWPGVPNCGQYDPDTGYDTDYCTQGWYETFKWSTNTLSSGTHHVGFYYVAGSNTWTSISTGGTTAYSNTYSPTATVTVAGKSTPALSVSCSANPITYGSQTTTCTSSLTGGSSPTGTISWTINGGAWTTTGINGSAGGFAGYAAGSYTIGVVYSGDGSNNSVSASTTLTINKASRTAGVSCSPNPTTYGNTQTTCTSTVSAGGGTMVFTYNGGTAWTSVAISGGSASAVGFGGAAVATYPVKVTASGDANYNDGATATVNYVVNKATPTLSVTCSPNSITYGSQTTNCTSSISGGTTGSINWTINGGAWTTTGLNGSAGGFNGSGAGSYTIGISYGGDGNNNGASGSTTLTINKQNTSLSASCSPNPVSYNTTYSCSATVSGADGIPTGTVTWPVTIWSNSSSLSAGSTSTGTLTATAHPGTYSGTATYNGDGNDNTSTQMASITVQKATPTCSTWPTASGITYGQTLGSSALSGGSCSVGGTFSWNSPGSVLGAGTSSQGVTFTPTDATDYNSVTGSVNVTVAKATPTVSAWPTASGFTYGQNLASSTLSGGSATTAGTFAWTTPSTTPGAGTNSYSVTFTPTDTTDYNTPAAGSVSVTTAKATPTVSVWPTAGGIAYGQTLASSTLSGGTATTAGTFAWTTPGTAPGAGTNSQIVKFTPTDTTDYNTVSGSVNVTVAKATPTVSAWPAASGIAYGQTLASSILSGGTATTGGTFAWTTPSTAPGAGTNLYSVTFTPTDTTDYNTPAAGSVSVTTAKATPTVSAWPSAGVITYGQALTSSALSGGAASVGGTFAWTIPSTVPPVGINSQSVSYTPTDGTNYNSVVGSSSITVNKSTPTANLASSASLSTYGSVVTFTVTLLPVGAGGAPTGTVTFKDGATILCNAVSLVGGSATCTIGALSPGAQSVIANYAGDSNYNTAISGTVTLIVNKAPAIVNVVSSVNPDTYGDTVTFTFTFTGSGVTPTGTATVTIDGTTVGMISLGADGTAFYTTSALNAGSRAVAAIYGGDSNYF